jgi:hypothetical protein
MASIRVGEVSNPIFPIPFDNGLMKEGGVPVPSDCPFFLCSLDVIRFLLGHQILVLVVKMLLKHVVLLRWMKVLLVKHLSLNLR